MIRFLFVVYSTSTNLTLLHVKPVNATSSRASSLRLSLIIILASCQGIAADRDVDPVSPDSYVLLFSTLLGTLYT